jgi:hypothetical protein
MKKITNFLVMATISLLFAITSCSKDDTTPEDPTDRTVTVSLSKQNNVSVDQWVYYSFEDKSEVEGIDSSNFETSMKWDIAFHSRHVRLNGGTSGQGQAEAYDAGIIDWDSIKKAPQSGYIKDMFVDSVLFAGVGPTGPILKGTFLNPAFETAFSFDMNTHPPTYKANNNVYIIKTKNGKFVKIMLTDYYNDMGESGYITFKYIYNADGSDEF